MNKPAEGPDAAAPQGRLVTGPTLGHVIRMTAAGSIGLVAVFAVDALNLFYITLLHQPDLTAALGYATTLLFLVLEFGKEGAHPARMQASVPAACAQDVSSPLQYHAWSGRWFPAAPASPASQILVRDNVRGR